MLYLLDTNILLHYFRQDRVHEFVEENYHPFSVENDVVISVVSLGEAASITLRNQWKPSKRQKMLEALGEILAIDIRTEAIIEKYAEIEAFSQNKIPNKPLPQGITARNMGKNDLWIAATASVIQATLLSTDKDFEHLDKIFLDFQLITL